MCKLRRIDMAYEQENTAMSTEDSLSHHGIFGQKWGKRNGPPYPLAGPQHSAKEKKLNNNKYGRDSSGNPVKSENTPNPTGGSGGGGGSSSSNSQSTNTSNNQNRNEHPQQNNNPNNPGNTTNTVNNVQNNQQHHSRDNKESREYERNLNRQKKLNDRQYNQLKKYQNDINRQQREINKQQRKIENQKAEVYRKELSNTQKERELKELSKQQRRTSIQQYAQQRNIRYNNEKLLEAQLNDFRNQQGYGTPPKNVSYAPPMPQYNFSVPTMTLQDYKRYKAKKAAIRTAKTAGKTALGLTAATAVLGSLGVVGAAVVTGNVNRRIIRNAKNIIDANPRTLKQLGKNAGSLALDFGKGALTIGKGAREVLTEGFESKKARRSVGNLFETAVKIGKKGDNRTVLKLNRKAVQNIIDNIGDSRRLKTKNLGKLMDNATDINVHKKIGEYVKAANIQGSFSAARRRQALNVAKLADKNLNKSTGSLNDLRKKVKVRANGTEAPLINYLIEHPEKFNEKIERAIRLERSPSDVSKILGAVKTRKKFLEEGESARDYILNNTGIRGLFNKTLSTAGNASDSFNKTMSTYKKTKGVMTTVGSLTVGAALAKRSKRKEQRMRDRIEEEMMDEYFFGRYR